MSKVFKGSRVRPPHRAAIVMLAPGQDKSGTFLLQEVPELSSLEQRITIEAQEGSGLLLQKSYTGHGEHIKVFFVYAVFQWIL